MQHVEQIWKTSFYNLQRSFNRLEPRNAITTAMYSTLAWVLDKINHDAAVRAVLWRGQPGIFTNGNDIQNFLDNPRASKAR